MVGWRPVSRNAAALFVLVALSVALMHVGDTTALAANTLSGSVFQDYNGNGSRDLSASIANNGGGAVSAAQDNGVGGVTVTAYTRTGAAVGSTTSAADGNYTLSTSDVGPYRIEFTNLPTGFEPGPLGATNGSTVRFVNDGTSTGVDLGIILPGEYCEDNPDLVTSCFRSGAQASVTLSSVQSFPYSAGSTIATTTIGSYLLPTSHTLSVASQTTGAVWGLEHGSARHIIYAAAFFKKHAGFGPGKDGIYGTTAVPGDDPGAIYLIDETSGLITDIFTVPGTTRNDHNTSNYTTDNYDQAWGAVGKTSLGGIALSDDETTLYVMNLENRTLYALNATTGAVSGQALVPGTGGSTVAAPPLPAPSPVSVCAAGDIRPFAVQYERGQIYVGITCTAESSLTVDTYTETNGNGRYDFGIDPRQGTGNEAFVDNDGNGIYNRGDTRQLRAYVYRVDPATLAFEATPYFQFGLSYPRGIANANGQPPAEWRPWVSGFDYISMSERTLYLPQPWLTDLSFDGANLLLVLRDRTGDTSGYRASVDAVGDLWDGVGVGDVLRACLSSGQLALENNGSCGGVTATPTPGGPALQPQGPGGGEYYFDDSYGITGQPSVNHDEASIGGSLQVPGHPEAVVTTFDAFPLRPPNEVFNGGFRWFTNSGADAGRFSKAYVLFRSGLDPLTFGKANGLGDLIVLCDAAPIEIGNRVWRDDDLDGTQDPDEPVIANVLLELYEGSSATPMATATTDANGNYLFSAYQGASDTAFRRGLPLKPNTQYTVRIPNVTGASQQAALVGLLPTLANAGGAANDARDSDGVTAQEAVQTSLTTGAAGSNRHIYDFGFVDRPTALTLEAFTARMTASGTIVSWRTALELDTLGFHLLRSTTELRADAVRVTARPLWPRGGISTGASYTYLDAAASEGPYSYWLEELSPTGSTFYGPVTTRLLAEGQQPRLWLPAVGR